MMPLNWLEESKTLRKNSKHTTIIAIAVITVITVLCYTLTLTLYIITHL